MQGLRDLKAFQEMTPEHRASVVARTSRNLVGHTNAAMNAARTLRNEISDLIRMMEMCPPESDSVTRLVGQMEAYARILRNVAEDCESARSEVAMLLNKKE